jgi:hypothetical protein
MELTAAILNPLPSPFAKRFTIELCSLLSSSLKATDLGVTVLAASSGIWMRVEVVDTSGRGVLEKGLIWKRVGEAATN